VMSRVSVYLQIAIREDQRDSHMWSSVKLEPQRRLMERFRVSSSTAGQSGWTFRSPVIVLVAVGVDREIGDVEDLVVVAAEGSVVTVVVLVVVAGVLVVTAEVLVVTAEALVVTVVAGVVVVVVVEIEAEGEEDEVRGQVVLHNLRARRLHLIDCILSFILSKIRLHLPI